MQHHVGIIGFGVVGEATAYGLKSLGHRVSISDIKDLSDYASDFDILHPYNPTKTDITFLCLPTPTEPLKPGGETDLSILESVIYETLIPSFSASRNGYRGNGHGRDNYHLFVIRSTVPPGITRSMGWLIERYTNKRLGEDFSVCSNPEFLRAFNNKDDFAHAPAIVIGEHDARGGELLADLYAPLEIPIHRMRLEEAELLKYVHNNSNATKIAYWNEVYNICKRLDLSFETIRGVVQTTAESLTNPDYGTHGGRPYGGTCLPKDSIELHRFLMERGISARVLESVILTNEEMKLRPTESSIDDYFISRHHTTYDNVEKETPGKKLDRIPLTSALATPLPLDGHEGHNGHNGHNGSSLQRVIAPPTAEPIPQRT